MLSEGAERVAQDTFTLRLTIAAKGAEGYPERTIFEMEVDPKQRRSNTAIRFPVRQPGQFRWVEIKTISEESWIRFFGLSEAPNGWIPVDLPSLFGEDAGFFMGTRAMADLQELVATVVEPQLVANRAVRGTLDLRQHPNLGAEVGKSSLPTAATAPFTATLDPQGRITNLTISFDQVEAGTGQWQFLYHSFGSRVPIEPPPMGEILASDEIDPDLLSALKVAAPR